ncbi:hypothetical protein RvY_09718 [Ramazzottius varieornatus]|uniref:Uncharacterized protein n=1 Tax=Ramazzottius varieornatus TaxID=947166 RepID=A0A1D1VAC5_RAMVA|nr:hypothetical protein RvY_09718 [Ramazzottius varieornatus]
MNEGLVRVQTAVESMIVVEKIVKADNLTEGEWRVLKGEVKFLGKFNPLRIRLENLSFWRMKEQVSSAAVQ